MAKLCLKVGGVTKKLDLDNANGSIVSAGDAPYDTKNTYWLYNYSDTLVLGMAYFRDSSYELQVWARVTKTHTSNTNPTIDIPVYNPGTDGKNRYPAGYMATFLILKGEGITFICNKNNGNAVTEDGKYLYSPAFVARRVIIP